MKLSIKENAWDSLEYAIQYYCKFLKLKNRKQSKKTHLKMTIIMLHNAIELFLKSILMDVNEFLIYDMNNIKQKKEIVKMYRNNHINSKDDTVESILTRNPAIKTIEFSEALELCASLLDMNYKYYVCCKQIAEYRNMIIHFGINLDREYYRVILCIDGLLKFVFTYNEGISQYISPNGPDISKESPLFKYVSLINDSENVLKEEYKESNEIRISKLIGIIVECINGQELNSKLDSMNIKIYIFEVDGEFKGIHIKYNNEYKDNIYLEMDFSPFHNIVYFKEYNSLQPFIIISNDKEEKKNLLFFKSNIENQKDWYENRFWAKYKNIISSFYFDAESFNRVLQLTCERVKDIFDNWDDSSRE
ncbi:hypothetical protein HYH43_13925 [Clostridium botulinum]|uniref:hypothetical protein n=1 Tax=Clostridium botulinum TaxID=1491 RepID=UPI001C9B7407|nr:hypothetical protein [Clostridium botulinum]MBY6790532.1 hypothetical protein [Clostridium botulinum]NFG76256.1 hypothetical protein [Clostridium botulinum]